MISAQYLGLWLTRSQSLNKALLAFRGEKPPRASVSPPVGRRQARDPGGGGTPHTASLPHPTLPHLHSLVPPQPSSYLQQG